MYGKMSWKYLTGFTDGDGHIGVCGRGTRVSWGQIDRNLIDCLINFLEENGFHPVMQTLKPKLPKRPNALYIVHLFRRSEVLRFMNKIKPFVILKRGQCEKVRKWLEEHPAVQNYDSIPIEKVRELVSQGYSARWIGKKFGFSSQKIWKYGKLNGIKFQPPGGRTINGRRQTKIGKSLFNI